MEKYLRKYMLAECRRLQQLKNDLKSLEEMRPYVIGRNSKDMNGQPRAKYTFGDVTSKEALELLRLDERIAYLRKEIAVIEGTREKLTGLSRRIFDETILAYGHTEIKAQLLGIGNKKLCNIRGAILTRMLTDLGLYIDVEKLKNIY